jgi:hypothetical protein
MQSKRILAAAVAPLFLGAISALAAGETQPAAPAAAQPAKDPYTFSVAAGASQMFDADIDEDGGQISRTRAGLALGLDANCTDTLTVKNKLNYTYDKYNFADSMGDPWEDVHTLSYAMLIDCKIDDTWTVFGGPMLAIAAEDGADWGDAMIPGVSIGAKYRFSPDLVVGLGVAGVQPIEDGFAVLPIILLDWKISDEFSVRNSSPIPGVTMGALGLEGVWAFADGWEAAVGAQMEKSRFRLSDNNGWNNGGVGQVTGVPVYARLDWKADKQITVSGIAGVIAGGTLRIDDQDGDQIGDDVDYDPAPFVGITASYRP